MADDLLTLWQAHRAAALPEVSRDQMGELWVLDEVIGGCVTHYLGAAHTLDAQRIAVLEDCRADLTRLLPDLDESAVDYFTRLGRLADLLLHAAREGGPD